MRDSMVSTEPKSYVRTNDAGSRITYNGLHQSLNRARDDAKKTVPVGRTYVHPTSYWNRSIIETVSPFDYKIKSGLGWIGFAGTSWANDCSGQLTYGANTGYLMNGNVPDIPNWAASILDLKLNSRINNQEFSFGQSLGELPETVSFILQQFRRLMLLYRAVKKLDWKSAAQVARSVLKTKSKRGFSRLAKAAKKGAKSLWLEMSYAWLPLVADVYNVIKAVSDSLSDPQLFYATASITDSPAGPAPRAAYQVMSYTFSCQREFKGKVCYKLTNPTLYQLGRYGLTNPLGLAWELFPLSFVVDWFLSVGNFVDALQGPLGLTFSEGYRTRYLRWSFDCTWLHQPGQIISGNPANYRGHLRAFSRDVYVTWPIPTPYFRGLGGLNLSKAISLLALAA